MTPLEFMLMELNSNRLEVVLAPSKRRDRREHDQIRVVVSMNAKWYRSFCAANSSARKRRNSHHDTCIKRFRTVAALEAMIAGIRSTYYRHQLSDIAARIKVPEEA